VLPGDAIDDGLIGYWTLEEGRGNKLINDVTELSLPAQLHGPGLTWTNADAAQVCTVHCDTIQYI
jgi:hypothetical protein